MGLFAIWYLHSPEGRRIVEAWEQRGLLAGAGVLAAYILLRLRPARQELIQPRSAWKAALRLGVGGIVAAGLWLAVDLLRGEDFLAQLWAVLPPQHGNALKALFLVGCGWTGWSIAVAELLRRFNWRIKSEE